LKYFALLVLFSWPKKIIGRSCRYVGFNYWEFEVGIMCFVSDEL